MPKSKTYFERIPLKIVKMIVAELAAEKTLAACPAPIKTCCEKYPHVTQRKENLND